MGEIQVSVKVEERVLQIDTIWSTNLKIEFKSIFGFYEKIQEGLQAKIDLGIISYYELNVFVAGVNVHQVLCGTPTARTEATHSATTKSEPEAIVPTGPPKSLLPNSPKKKFAIEVGKTGMAKPSKGKFLAAKPPLPAEVYHIRDPRTDIDGPEAAVCGGGAGRLPLVGSCYGLTVEGLRYPTASGDLRVVRKAWVCPKCLKHWRSLMQGTRLGREKDPRWTPVRKSRGRKKKQAA